MAGFRCLKISAICFLAAITATACGQERTWTSGNGKYEIEATMVEQLDDSVKLKRSDNGKLITVPLNRLSKADQDFLNTRLGAVSSSKPDAPDSGSSTKGSTTEGSSTKGSTEGNSTEGNSTEGSSSKASSPEDSAARGSSTKDSSPNGSATKGSATKGSATKGSSTKLANLNVSARAQWSKFPYENENARDLELLIEAKGEAAATAVRFGLLKMQTCETDKGPIETKEENFRMQDITKEFAKVKRSEQEFFNEHPKDGVRVVLKFEHPNEELSRFETVKGEFKIKTGGSRQTIELADVFQTLDKNIDDPKLKALGLEVKPNRDEGNVRIGLQGKLDSVVKVHLLDQRGNKPDGLLGTSWGGAGNAFSYNFQFENDASIPANLMFRIDVAEDLEELAIPFDLQKVDIPSK